MTVRKIAREEAERELVGEMDALRRQQSATAAALEAAASGDPSLRQSQRSPGEVDALRDEVEVLREGQADAAQARSEAARAREDAAGLQEQLRRTEAELAAALGRLASSSAAAGDRHGEDRDRDRANTGAALQARGNKPPCVALPLRLLLNPQLEEIKKSRKNTPPHTFRRRRPSFESTRPRRRPPPRSARATPPRRAFGRRAGRLRACWRCRRSVTSC